MLGAATPSNSRKDIMDGKQAIFERKFSGIIRVKIEGLDETVAVAGMGEPIIQLIRYAEAFIKGHDRKHNEQIRFYDIICFDETAGRIVVRRKK